MGQEEEINRFIVSVVCTRHIQLTIHRLVVSIVLERALSLLLLPQAHREEKVFFIDWYEQRGSIHNSGGRFLYAC